MLDFIEQIFTKLEAGKINRREAVVRMASLVIGMAGLNGLAKAQERNENTTFASNGLNHVALRVTDVARSRDFYQKHLGLTVLRDNSPYNCFMGAGENNFVALFRSESAGMDHYCYTIDNYNAGRVVKKLKAAGLDPRRAEDRVLYFKDPDGLTVQLTGAWDDFPGPRPR